MLARSELAERRPGQLDLLSGTGPATPATYDAAARSTRRRAVGARLREVL